MSSFLSSTAEVIFGLPAPLELSGIARGEIVDNEPTLPGTGFTVPYSSRLIEVTLYLYDQSVANIPDDPLSEIVRNHFHETTRHVQRAAEVMGTRLTLISTFGVGLPGGGLEFLSAKFIGEDSGGPFMSIMYLTAKNGKFVKLRMRCREKPEVAEEIARSVANAYADLLWPSHAAIRVRGAGHH